MKKKALIIVLSVLTACGVAAGASVGTLAGLGTFSGNEVNKDNNTLVLREAKPNEEGILAIPHQFNGVYVSEIGNKCFQGRNDLKNVSIGSNILSIGSKAFANCTSLALLNIPKTVREIAPDAFDGCSNLVITTEYSFNEWVELYKGSLNRKNVHCASYDVMIKNQVVQRCAYGDTLTMSPKSIKGYTFNKWIITSLDDVIETKNQNINMKYDFGSNISLSTNYTNNKYRIYLFNENYDVVGQVPVVYDEYPTNVPVPVKTGYTFLGYFTNDFIEYPYFNSEGAPITYYMDTNDMYLYQRWEANKYQASFVTRSDQVIQPQIITYDDYFYLPAVEERFGYIFNGWKIQGTSTILSDSFKWNYAHDVVFEAVWTPKVTNVSFDSQGGTSCISTQYTFDSIFDLPTTTRIGYDFTYWSINGVRSYDHNLWKHDDSSLVIKANWEAHITTVTFDVKGGQSISKERYTYDQPYNLPTPTRFGYNFVGWYRTTGEPMIKTGSKWQVPELTLTLEARWEAKKCTVTFDSQGGSFVSPIVCTFDQTYQFTAPTRTGYIFKNWLCESTGVSYGTSRQTWNREETALTMKAIWEARKTTIYFNSQGGSSISSQVNTYDLEYTFPAPTRTGYIFDGWYWNDTLMPSSGIWLYENTSITLKAHWIAKKTQVTFDSQGGTEVAPVTCTYDQKYQFTAPTKTGYTFRYWYCESIGKSFDTYQNTWQEENESLTLKAIWDANSTYLTFDSQGGSYVYDKTVTYDSSYSLSTPTKTGYNFAGWFYGDEEIALSGTWKRLETSLTLVAHWTAKTTSITFDSQGGTEVAPVTCTYDQTYQFQAPTKEGYNFSYWYCDSISTSFNTSQGTWKRTEQALTLRAVWSAKSTYITFDSQGGSSVSGKTIAFDSYYSLTTPTRTGYNFAGWYLNDVKIDQSGTWKRLETNLTLVAHWTAKTTSITFNSNGGTEVAPVTCTYDQTYQFAAPTRTGYNFTGWYCSTLGRTFDTEAHTWQYTNTSLSMTAQWSIKTSNVTFDSQGGSSVSSKTCTYNSSYSLSSPTRTGYIFSGWYYGDVLIPNSGTWAIEAANVQLVAHWTAKTTEVSFNSDGGSSCESMTMTYDQSYTLPTSEKENYNFFGWKLSDDTIVPQTGTWNYDVSSLNLTAVWVGDLYVLSFDTQSSESELEDMNVYFDGPYTLPTPTKTGYKFLGWKDNISSEYIPQSGTWNRSYSQQSVQLTAYYELYVTDVTFDSLGGTSVGDMNIEYGETVTIPSSTKTGYDFAGWNFNDVKTIPAGEYVWDIEADNASLEAIWTPHTSNVHLDGNGSSFSDDISIDYDEEYTLPTPSYSGHFFDGWMDTDTSSMVPQSGIWTIDESDVNLEAQWSSSKTITFDSQGGSSVSSKTIYLDDSYTLSTPTKTNAFFLGWYNENNELIPQSGTATSALFGGVSTLTAKWVDYSKSSSYSYGFNLDSDGYFASTNGGVNSSTSGSTITFNLPVATNLTIYYVISSESSYDMGYLTNVDSTSSYIVNGTSGSSSSSYNCGTLSAGTHTITMRYSKDGSVNSGSDNFRVKLVFTPA